jgi:hypothetical protein
MLILHSSHPINPRDPNHPPTRSTLPHTQRKRVRGHTASAAASLAVAAPAGRGTVTPSVGATPPVPTSCEQGRDTQMSPGQKAVVVSFPYRSLPSAQTLETPTPCRVRAVSKKVASAGRGGDPKCVCGPNSTTDRPIAHAPWRVRTHLVLLCGRSSIRVVRHHCFASVHAGEFEGSQSTCKPPESVSVPRRPRPYQATARLLGDREATTRPRARHAAAAHPPTQKIATAC